VWFCFPTARHSSRQREPAPKAALDAALQRGDVGRAADGAPPAGTVDTVGLRESVPASPPGVCGVGDRPDGPAVGGRWQDAGWHVSWTP